jgi:carboxypeptidase C (cathepsin A)
MKWLILLTTLLLVNCQDSGDWVDPFALPISFGVHPFYAGYLDIDEGKSIYYVYTPSENNPSKDPLVVLLSPGPGCSVLHSWLYSKSEFVFVRNTSNFRTNTNHWSRIANVLYL